MDQSFEQVASNNNATLSPWPFIVFNGTGILVTGGNTLVLLWSAPEANTLESIIDNYGNSWSQIPGAGVRRPQHRL